MSIFDKIPIPGKGGGDSFNPANSVKNELDNFRRQIQQEVDGKVNKLRHEVDSKVHAIDRSISSLPKEVLEGLKSELHKAVEKAVKAGLSVGYQELKNNINIIKGLSINIDFGLFTNLIGGGISLGWTGLKERALKAEDLVKMLKEAKNKDIQKRAEIINLVKTVGPDNLSVSVSALTIDLDVFLGVDRLDYYLGRIGVPK